MVTPLKTAAMGFTTGTSIMKKYLLPFLLCLVANPVSAELSQQGEFYAKLNVNGQLADEGEDSFSEIRSNNSWIGVKGDIRLQEELSVVYRLEWKVDITGEKGVDNLTERPQYVGLRGRFGELTLGRNFTALWMAQGKIDLYNHYEGDIAAIWKGENRLSDVATYTSPTWHGFHAVLTYQAEKSSAGDDAISAGLFYGDANLKSSAWFVALAQDFDVAGFDVTRASVQHKLGAGKLGIMLQRQDPSAGGDARNGALASYSHRWGEWEWRAQLQSMEDDRTYNLGFDYHLGKQTKVYAWAAHIEQDDNPDRRYLALGFEHKLSIDF